MIQKLIGPAGGQRATETVEVMGAVRGSARGYN